MLLWRWAIYISVPFCRTKCSYCNFASDVFSRAVFERYVERVCGDIEGADRFAEAGGKMERAVDSVYLGGGTPTVLETGQLERIFGNLRQKFDVRPMRKLPWSAPRGRWPRPCWKVCCAVG